MQLKPKDDTKLSGPLRYIVDSGSAFHIANKRELSSELLARVCNLDPALKMETVNGSLTVSDGLHIEVPALKRGMKFALLPHSPSIISLGRLCMLDGFSLHWPARQAPYLIDPGGHKIELMVESFVPYISGVDGSSVTGAAVDVLPTSVSTTMSHTPISLQAGAAPHSETDVEAAKEVDGFSEKHEDKPGSSKDPPSLEGKSVPPPPGLEWGVYGNDDSDPDSVDSFEMSTNPDLPAPSETSMRP